MKTGPEVWKLGMKTGYENRMKTGFGNGMKTGEDPAFIRNAKMHDGGYENRYENQVWKQIWKQHENDQSNHKIMRI